MVWNRKKKYLAGLLLYLAAVSIYILVSRTPGYFSSEKTSGIVKHVYTNSYGTSRARTDVYNNPVVEYNVNGKLYSLFRENMWYMHEFSEGETLTVIYNPSDPADANIYLFISYWVTMTELFVMIMLFLPVVAFIEGQYN